jgi:hypothetical protein
MNQAIPALTAKEPTARAIVRVPGLFGGGLPAVLGPGPTVTFTAVAPVFPFQSVTRARIMCSPTDTMI